VPKLITDALTDDIIREARKGGAISTASTSR
jgi:hypothetical protein